MSEVGQNSDDVDQESWRTVIAPLIISPQGEASQIPVHVVHGDEVSVTVAPLLGDGGEESFLLEQVDVWVEPQEIDGVLTGRATFEIGDNVDAGYYRLHVDSENRSGHSVLIVEPPHLKERSGWGLFVDIPGTRDSRAWGVGDLSSLRELAVLSAGWGAQFIAPTARHLRSLRFAGSERAPRGFIGQHILDRYLHPVLLRIEDVVETAYVPAPDRALIEWEAEELTALSDTEEPLDVATVWQAKQAALELVGAVELSAARRREFEEFCRAEGTDLDHFAQWCAIAEKTFRDQEPWPADAASPESAGAARAADHLQEEIERHKWYQWLLHDQWRTAHESMRYFGAQGLVRFASIADVGPIEVGEDFINLALALRPLTRDCAGLVVELPLGEDDDSQATSDETFTEVDLDVYEAIIAVEAARANIPIFIDAVSGSPETLASVSARNVNLWDLEEDGRFNSDRVSTHDLVSLPNSRHVPLANYLDGEFIEQVKRRGANDEELEEVRRESSRAYDVVFATLSDADLIDNKTSHRAIIEALHQWMVDLPTQWVGIDLSDLVGQRRWQPEIRVRHYPLSDGLDRRVVVDDFDQGAVARSLLRKISASDMMEP